jgi:hypothetical protein
MRMPYRTERRNSDDKFRVANKGWAWPVVGSIPCSTMIKCFHAHGFSMKTSDTDDRHVQP